MTNTETDRVCIHKC